MCYKTGSYRDEKKESKYLHIHLIIFHPFYPAVGGRYWKLFY